jgi:NAD(P)-dependent dehydrogenase (short-subunit alcohol dehydrogenase family)
VAEPASGGEFAAHVAVVTGSGSGIGAATAHAFAREGARVYLFDISAERVCAVAAEIQARHGAHSAVPVVVDIVDDDAVSAAIARIESDGGVINHLVNCAVDFVAAGLAATRAQWDHAFGVNVVGQALLTAKAAALMPPGSTIVNISSISAHAAQPDRWTYNACKAAILALTRGEALDLRRLGIRANAVSPGWIWTPEVAKAAEFDREKWEPVWGAFHILERLGEPAEVADAVLYLSSTRSSFVTGAELFVDGGYHAIGPEGLGQRASFAGTTATE